MLLTPLLILEQFLKNQKREGTTSVHTGGSIIPLSVLITGISILKKLFANKNPPKTGKGITKTQVRDAIKTIRSAKIGSGLKVHTGGFIFTIPLLLSAIGAIGALAGGAAAITNAVHNKSKNDAELEEQKRHNLAMETKSEPPNVAVGSSIRSRTRKRKSIKKTTTVATKNLVSLRL